MNKVLFFNWQFSNEPINFLKLTSNTINPEKKSWISSSTVIDNQIQEETIIHHNESVGLNDLEKDIHWISNLEQLEQIVKKYNGLIVKEANDNFVIGSGPLDGIMVIGESPDHINDQWDSFVGDHKILLKKMLNYINVNIEDVYITKFSYWQPKNNRALSSDEVDILRKFIIKQIDIIQPKRILLLGNVASNGLLKIHKPLNTLRGQIYKIQEIPTVVTFNPGFLKRFPNFSTEAKKDMDIFKNLEV